MSVGIASLGVLLIRKWSSNITWYSLPNRQVLSIQFLHVIAYQGAFIYLSQCMPRALQSFWLYPGPWVGALSLSPSALPREPEGTSGSWHPRGGTWCKHGLSVPGVRWPQGAMGHRMPTKWCTEINLSSVSNQLFSF